MFSYLLYVPAKCPRGGSAQTVVSAVTLGQKSQIQLAVSPNHSMHTH